jgi:hypothetical protein
MNAEARRIESARASVAFGIDRRGVRSRAGRHAVLAFVLRCLADGRGWPAPAHIAAALNWKNERSVRSALARLERDGLVRRIGRSPAWGQRNVWEVTALANLPASAWPMRPTPKRPRAPTVSEPMAAAA